MKRTTSHPVGQRRPASLQYALLDGLVPLERLVQGQQLVHEHAEGEAIHFLCVLFLAVVHHDLGGHEAFSATEAFGAGR